MKWFWFILLAVLVLPGLAIIVAVVLRLLVKGTRGGRVTPSAREVEGESRDESGG